MLRRITALLLAGVLAISLLTSCGEGKTKAVTSTSPVTVDENFLEINSTPKELTEVKKGTSGEKTASGAKLFELKELETKSPDGRITATFWLDENDSLYYGVRSDKNTVIEPSKLGITMSSCDFSKGLTKISGYNRCDAVYDIYDTCLTVSNANYCVDYCLEREVFIEKGDAKLTLRVRVYNDGFAFRYEDVDCGKSGRVFVMSEATEINLPKGTTTFAGGYSATYEFDYIKRSYDELKNHGGVFNTPLTADTGSNWLLFSESDVYANDISYCKCVLETRGGSNTLNWAFGFKRDPAHEVNDDLSSPGHIRIEELKTQNGFTTPWRATIIADDLNGLLNSSLIDSLCPEMDTELFKDTSWIKPGKVSWSWWSGGDQHNYDIQVDHVDFSAKYGWEYCCLDAGWPTFENRIEELCKYAKKKNVGIILWVNYLNLKTPEEIEALFSQWSKWGVVGVKTDYFESDDIEVLECMKNVAEIGAKHKLMIYYHGCINPCGETRTYPNIMSSEAVLGEEFRKWSTSPSPTNCLMYPFTRNITGSMDYTPACIAITKTGESAGFSIAKAVVYESSLQHFASSAYAFPSFIGLPLLSRIPCAWDEMTVIDGYPGEHITLVRRSGDDYYIGSMTIDKRKVNVPLSFLGEGEYNMYVYTDNKDGILVLEESKVTSADTLKLDLIAIGGAAVLITKDTMDTEVDGAAGDKEGYTYYECEDGKLSGDARVSDSNMCSGGKKVGYVGNGSFNKVAITVNVDKAGEYDMLVCFCTGEARSLNITIGDDKYEMNNLTSPGFDIPAEKSIKVKLAKGKNTIILSCNNGYAPDLDRIAISDKTV